MNKIIKIQLLLIIFALLTNQLIFAQTKDAEKHFRKTIIEADEYFEYKNYIEALPLFEELYSIDSNNTEVNYKLAVCRYFMKYPKNKLIKFFEVSKNQYIDAYYYLGLIYHSKELFIRALEHFKYYLNSSEQKKYTQKTIRHKIEKSLAAKKMIAEPINAEIINLGKNINTAAPEYVPVLTVDEQTMYFTSRRKGSTGGMLDPLNKYFEDIYVSKKTDSTWSKPKNLGKPVNSETHDATVSLSGDGKQMFIYRTNKELTGGDIYSTKKIDNEWSIPKKLSSEINSEYGLETCAILSPDEQTIYFSSNREGGYGGKDLYRIKKMPNENWSKAQNLGPTINTPYDEDSPFIHPDGKTLFFSSKGHHNIGGYDIFEVSKTEYGWTAPKNMGYPINTVSEDIFFVVSADGKRAYYSSTKKGGFGSSDIYSIKLPDQEKKYVIFKGDITTNEPKYKELNATITVIDFQTKKIQGIYRTNKNTGKYLMVLLPKKHYKIIVEAEGYYNFIDEIDMRKKLRIEDLFKNISMKKIKQE